MQYKGRFFIILVVLSFLISVNLVAQNINPNGGFEEATPGTATGTDVPGWNLMLGGAAAADFEIVADEYYEGTQALRVEITNLGTNPWDIQIVNEPFTVDPTSTYTFAVWVRAEGIEGAVVDFTVGNPAYTEFGRLGATISTDWQEVTFEFETLPDASDARAPIHLGQSANASLLPLTLYFDDLRITSGTVGVDDDNNSLKYALEQNYPNPFNPSTNIQFSVPVQSDVRITLYDVVGNVVDELVNKNYQPGNYRIPFDGSNLSTGVYFYKIQAGNFVDVKKLMLMK